MNEFYNKLKYFEETEKIPSEIYYHYTSLDSLFYIVDSKTFRLTSLKSSNDAKELFYKTDEFINDISKILEETNEQKCKEFLEIIIKSIEIHNDVFLKLCKEKRNSYALCLSEKRDNLTHWDRYAVGCTGVCIAFNVSALKVLIQRMAFEIIGDGLFDVGKIIYSKNGREDFITRLILRVLVLFETKSNYSQEKRNNIILDNGYLYAACTYRIVKIFSKVDSFIDEDEIRLYHEDISIKDCNKLIKGMENQISDELYKNLNTHFLELVDLLNIEKENFYFSKNGIRGYKNLCLSEVWGSGVIPEIILGPMCVQNKSELRKFLDANGLQGTKISVSKVPIR